MEEFAIDPQKGGKFIVVRVLARDGSECVVGDNDPSVWQRCRPMNSRRLCS